MVEMLGKQKAITHLHMTKQNVMAGCLLSAPQRLHWTRCAWKRQQKRQGDVS